MIGLAISFLFLVLCLFYGAAHIAQGERIVVRRDEIIRYLPPRGGQ